MKYSGYKARVRGKVIAEGLRAQEKLEEKERTLGTPANRSKGTLEEQVLRRQKKRKGYAWYNKDSKQIDRTPRPQDAAVPYTTTLFVPPTWGSGLAKELQKVERANNQGRDWGIKVVERRGPTILQTLSRSDPWPRNLCPE